MVAKLTEAERDALGDSIPAWEMAAGQDAIVRTFKFENFSQAWGFMSRVALLAEQQDHHPDWSNAWNRVQILLTTHAAGGLSESDVRLARAIDGIA
jgi:4a-hydroxytetrahydrobiopterin dehydratase